MTLSHVNRLKSVAAVLPVVIILYGCASGTRSAPGGGALAEGVDREKAFLKLEDIPPPLTWPKPVPVRELTSRAAEQLSRADALASEQRYTEALLELERGLRFDPKHPQLLARQAWLHERAGNVDRARIAARAALESDPLLASMHALLGRAAAAEGRLGETVEHLRRAVLLADSQAQEPAQTDRYYLAGALTQLGYLTAALDQYAALASALSRGAEEPELKSVLSADETGVYGRAAEILDRLGRAPDAIAMLAAADPSRRTTVRERELHVRLLLKLNRVEEARRIANELPYDHPQTLSLQEEVYRRLGRPEALIQELRARLARRPDDTALALALADVCVRQNHPQACIDDLRAFVLRAPHQVDIRDRLLAILLSAQRFDEALALCEFVAAADPSSLGALTLSFEGLNAAAIEAVLKTETTRTTPEAAYFRAVAALAAGQPERARQELSRYPDFVAKTLSARRLLGRAALAQYRWAEAQEAAKRKDPDVAEDPGLERILAQAALGLDDLARAEQHYKSALQLDRRDEPALMGLAQIYGRTDRRLQYEQQLQAVLEVNPLNLDAREALIFEYLRAGRVEEVARNLKEFDAIAPGSSGLARCVAEIQRRQQGNLEGFRGILEQAIERNGPDSRTLILLGDAHAQKDDTAAARARYEQALALDPANEDAFMRLVGLDSLDLAFEQALDRLTPWLERYPNRHAWRLEKVQALTVVQRFEEALATAEAEAARDDLDVLTRAAYRERILELLLLMDREPEAVSRLEAWAAPESGNGPWTRRLIEQLLTAGRISDAVAVARRAYEASEDKLVGEMYVNALVADSDVDAGLRIVLDWLDEDPTSDLFALVLAGKLNLANRPDDALEVLYNLLEVTSDPDVVRQRIVSVLRRADRHEESIRFVESWIGEIMTAAREAESRPGARLERIEAAVAARLHELQVTIVQELILARRFDDAAIRVQQLLEATLDPERQRELLMLAYQAYTRGGREAEAFESLQRCLALRPFDAGTNNDLGYLLAERGERLEEAMRMTRFAVARSPRNSAYLDSYGWVLYKLGDFESAYTWILRATRAERRENEVILDHLGDAAWRTGRKSEAVAAWKRALAAAEKTLVEAPDDPEARQVRDRASAKIEAARGGGNPSVADVATDARRRT